MNYSIRFGDKYSKWTGEYGRVYSCSQDDYPILKECLLRAVGEDRAFETEDGLTIKDGNLDLGADNILKFQDDCRMVLTCGKMYGAQSDELFAVSDYLFSPGQYKDLDSCGVPVPTEDAIFKVVRDVHGCFMGVYTLEAARKEWRETKKTGNAICIERAVDFDEASLAVSRMTRIPFYWHNLCASKSVVEAYRSQRLESNTIAAEQYWHSQLDVAWDVFFAGEEPACTVPYSVILCSFGRSWFCSGPHTAQIVPGSTGQNSIERALILANQIYEAIAPVGEVCTRKDGKLKNAVLVCAQNEIITDSDGLASVIDAEGRLLGLWQPRAIIKKYGVVVSVNDGYRTFDSTEKYPLINKQHVLRMLRDPSTSAMHKRILIKALKGMDQVVYVCNRHGSFIGYFRESYIWSSWPVINTGKRYVVEIDATDRERSKLLSRSLVITKGLSQQMRIDLRDELRDLNEREARRARTPPLKKGLVNGIVKMATGYAFSYLDSKTADRVIKTLKFRLERNQPKVIVGRVRRGLDTMGTSHFSLNGDALTPEELVARAWQGDEGAICLVAEAMARDIEAGGVSQPASKPMPVDDIPDWAKPQRAYVLEWADRTLAEEDQLKNQPAVLYVASAIKSGKADVLVFDSPLYDEVVSAELEGRAEYDAASWPYPVSVVRLVGLPGIYGVAVCRASDVNAYAKRQGLPQLSEAGSLHTFFIGDGLSAVDASLKARREAERLITYLDCDNANINTIYIDGGPRTDRRNEPAGKPQDDAEYRVGADYVTGTKVVVERDQQRDAPRQTRRAHFRRGFHKRFRIGPREDWHYEIRWVKPTFVHGSSQAVTQHKVTRIVLG